MRLFLCRHGNTFGPTDKVVRVGASEDLPLVPRGMEQAEELANYFRTIGVRVSAVYSGPLQRTRQTAHVLIKALSLPFEYSVDERLNEIDYGKWGGLTSEEIISQFGEQELLAWDDKSVWPTSGVFNTDKRSFIDETLDFARSLQSLHSNDDAVVVVSSNGRIRYFLKLIPLEFEKRQADGKLKVKTGHLCELESDGDRFRVNSWNVSPS